VWARSASVTEEITAVFLPCSSDCSAFLVDGAPAANASTNSLADPNGDTFRTDEISIRPNPAACARDRISSGSDKENGGIGAGFVPDCSAKVSIGVES
jgi:hypothetical protein